jgi:hypothetical protein
MEELTLTALIVLVAGTIVKEVFSYFKQRALNQENARLEALEKSLSSLKITLEPAIKEIKDMYDWHNKSDEDGVKIWYIRKSLEMVLRENAQETAVLARNSELQTTLLREMIEGQKTIMTELREQARARGE